MRCLTWSVAVFGALLGASLPVLAGSFSVNPVKVELSENQPATSLRVHNAESQPLTVQIAVKQWSQPGGEDVLRDTRDIIAVPPMFTLAPGGDQIVRVGLRKPSAVSQEQAYRLLLKEIPASTEGGRGLHLALTMSLPVFVQPVVPARPELDWQLRRVDGGQLSLLVVNRGSGHFKFTEWRVLADGDKLAANKKLEYLLPGASKQWTVEPAALPAVGDTLDVQVVSAGNKLTTRATVE